MDRVPEEDAELLKFLGDAQLAPGRRITLLEGMPYLGVMQVETEAARISIGYNVARQIVVRPGDTKTEKRADVLHYRRNRAEWSLRGACAVAIPHWEQGAGGPGEAERLPTG